MGDIVAEGDDKTDDEMVTDDVGVIVADFVIDCSLDSDAVGVRVELFVPSRLCDAVTDDVTVSDWIAVSDLVSDNSSDCVGEAVCGNTKVGVRRGDAVGVCTVLLVAVTLFDDVTESFEVPLTVAEDVGVPRGVSVEERDDSFDMDNELEIVADVV